jgi:hypothetical protein
MTGASASGNSIDLSEKKATNLGRDSLDFYFNWLPATDKDLATNNHLAPSPICGWIINNHLDRQLEIVDRSGVFLGAIDQNGVWVPIPGQPKEKEGAQGMVKNTHLLQLVLWIVKKASEDEFFMDTFQENIGQAVENIDSTNVNGTPQSLAVLLNKPLALVRTSIKVERKVEVVEIPVNLIGQEKLNSGLVAFWIENFPDQTYRDNTYYTRFNSKAFNPQTSNLKPLSDHSEISISMLIDPLSSVHATTGNLPAKVKVLQLSPEWYTSALKLMHLRLNTSPILLQYEKKNYPLPQEQTYDWLRQGQNESAGLEKDAIIYLSKKELEKQYPSQASLLWDKLVANNSLLPINEKRALITLKKSTLPLNKVAPDLFPELGYFLNSRKVD